MHVYVAISFLNLHVQVQQVRYIRERKEQLRIVQACHGDQTSGHLGYRKTLARITERFMWKKVSKDAKEIVRCTLHEHVIQM